MRPSWIPIKETQNEKRSVDQGGRYGCNNAENSDTKCNFSHRNFCTIVKNTETWEPDKADIPLLLARTLEQLRTFDAWPL